MTKTALVVGASGIVGSATATLLVDHGWRVHGLARRPTQQDGVLPVAADLQDAAATQAAACDESIFRKRLISRTQFFIDRSTVQSLCKVYRNFVRMYDSK